MKAPTMLPPVEARDTPPACAVAPASPHFFWIASSEATPVSNCELRQGLNTIEVATSGPRYLTLHVACDDDALAPLMVPLDVASPGRYRRTFSLYSEPGKAWLEVAPTCGSVDVVSIDIRSTRLRDLATMSLRAALRHARSPRAFLAKLRQVVAGGGNMVFSANATQGAPDTVYRNWQAAFESEHETRRIVASLEARIGTRPVRMLAVIANWDHGVGPLRGLLSSLAQGRRTTLEVLNLMADEQLLALEAEALAVRWVNSPCASMDSLPGHVIARAIEQSKAELVVFLDRPGRFHDLTAPCLALALELDPTARAVYADHDRLNAAGERRDPVFKPAWSPDYAATSDYTAQPLVFRGDPGFFAGLPDPLSPSCPSFSLLMQLTKTRAAVQHVPRVLFHEFPQAPISGTTEPDGTKARVIEETLRLAVEYIRSGAGEHTRLRRISRVMHASLPAVSVIIPSKDNPDLLARACRSVTECGYAPAEIIVVDNGSTSEAQLTLLSALATSASIRVVRDSQPFSFSRLINFGRRHSTGEILVLLNDDVEAIDNGWLHELVSQASRPGIGCVGALLLYPDGRVQHGGIVLGINGGAGHAFRFSAGDADGNAFRLKVAHEVSAVTAACLAVRAQVFDEVGGFAEDLPVTLNDVDFCLKVRQCGYRNLFTPHARLSHRESTSRGFDVTPERLRRLAKETAVFRHRWGDAALVDPFYSPHLTLGHEDYGCREI